MTPARSFSDVLQDIVHSLQEIIRAEVRLAKVEITDDARDLVRSGLWLVAAAACVMLAVGLGLWSAVYVLARAMPMWGATLVVAAVLAMVGAVLANVGLRKARQWRPWPERTIATVKENLEWIKPSSN